MTAEAGQVYYTTSYAFGTGTTSTAALTVWRAISNKLQHEHRPMTGEELVAATALTLPYIDRLFVQTYYQKHYGFRKFDTLEAWRTWAEDEGVIFVASKHIPVSTGVNDPTDDDLDEESASE
jgi:hypothetical protein